MRNSIKSGGTGALATFALVATLSVAPVWAESPPYDPEEAVTVVDLNVNGLFGEQLGLGDTQPTLAWRMTSDVVDGNPCFTDSVAGTCALDRQTGYEVQAAVSPDALDDGDLIWGTGKVESSEQTVEFGGEAAARDSVYWRVRVWDANENPSPWSEASVFTVGLLDPSDWSAEWIEDPEYTYQTDGVPNPLPVFATQFDLDRPVESAFLYATGLGQYAATLNGAPIGDAVLEPGQTSYWAEVNYRTYDVTDLVQQDGNVLGMEVGSGVYQQADTTSMDRYNFQPVHKEVMGAPKVRAQLEITYADGETQTVATDESWRARPGPTVFSSWWGGEDYDARIMPTGWTASTASLTETPWHDATLVSLDDSTIPRDTTPLVADPRPPVKVAEEVTPVSVTEQQPDAVNTSVVESAAEGDTRVKTATTVGLFAGDTIDLAGEQYTVTDVGISAKRETTLTAPAEVGDTTISVASVGADCYAGAACEGTDDFVVGQSVVLGTGTTAEAVTVTGVARDGDDGDSPGTVSFTPALELEHGESDMVRSAGTGIAVTPELRADVPQGTALTSDPRPAYVLDFGRNLVGLPKINGEAPEGTTITLLGSEQPEPPTDYDTVGETGIYRYTFAGTGEESWHSQFTYNGQRYMVVRGLASEPPADMVSLLVTYASNEETATFETCDDMLNSVYDITERALEGNMISVLTDCPNREKGPYTGDNLHNIDAELTMFDMRAYQNQLVANMRTSQRPHPVSEGRQPGLYEGMITNIAPEFHSVPDGLFGGRWFLDDPNWGGAIIRIPWELYQVYGDTTTMEENYDAMVTWLEYVGRSKETNPTGEIYGLGDWMAGQETEPAEAIIDIGYFEGAHVLSQIAEVLGNSADAETYRALAAELKEEYNEDYLHVDDETGRAWYANDTQASNASALDSGLVPEEHRDAVFDSLVAAVEAYDFRLGHGSVAGGAVFRALREGGRDDLLYRMIINPEAPSYAHQVERGQTTLSEDLSGGGSQNHHFLGQVAAWSVNDLAGIAQKPESTGYGELVVKPAVGEGIDDIACVNASYTTPRGVASNSIVRDDDGLAMDVTIPANTVAEIWVPNAEDEYIATSRQPTFLRDDSGYSVYEVGAGSWSFAVGAEEPTDPGTDDPTDPGTDDPTGPGTDDPTDPGADPTDSDPDPTGPGADPTDPGVAPTDGASGGGDGLPSTGADLGLALLLTIGLLAAGGAGLSVARKHLMQRGG